MLLCLALAFPAHSSEKEDEDADMSIAPSARMKMAGPSMEFADMGVGVGGSQDIGYFRDRVAAGEIPHPNVFTPEGLLSEHDLPLDGPGGCKQLLCPVAAAMPATLLAQPEVAWLAQLGFDSGVEAATFRRAPVNIVAVVDKSGSMSGEPIESVKASLRAMVGELQPTDQVSIVLYGADVETHLAPTSMAEKGSIEAAIRSISIDGSTNMEAGLTRGFEVATASATSFDGITRVMLFTDERPNTGRTDADSFMGMARAASQRGIGMTTVGVGTQFGAELAAEISSVRGGNLYFFPDAGKMQATFRDDLDTMVTELAYDMELRLKPAQGMKIAGVYGIPGDAVTWEGDTLVMNVETLFLSHEEGAIFFAFTPSGPLPPRSESSMGTVSLAWELRSGERASSVADIAVTRVPQAGLVRGAKLVDEVTVFKAATALHHEKNDQEGAYQLVHALAGRLAGDRDAALLPELDLIAKMEAQFAKLSGHQGEMPRLVSDRDSINGLPRME